MSLCCQFRYADKLDVLLMLIGTIFAMATGTCMQISFAFVSDVINAYVQDSNLKYCLPESTILSLIFSPSAHVSFHHCTHKKKNHLKMKLFTLSENFII